MDSYRPQPPNDKSTRNSVWREDSSTVGFARLQDEEGAISPLDVQRSVYGNIGSAVSTAGSGEKKALTPGGGIVKEIKVDQHEDYIDHSSTSP